MKSMRARSDRGGGWIQAHRTRGRWYWRRAGRVPVLGVFVYRLGFWLFAMLLAIGFGPIGPPVSAQDSPSPQIDPLRDHLDRLKLYRTRITDPQARLEERRHWSEALLKETVRTQTHPSKALVLELLGASQSPEVQRALCEAFATGLGADKDLLDSALAEPLLELLGADNAELRSAAARALAEFPGADVANRLAAIAAQPDAAMAKRKAAIDALAPSTHRRHVVAQLMELLDVGTPEIVTRVLAALEPVCREPLGEDAALWREWWAAQSRLSNEAWLADQLRMFRDRLRNTRAESEGYRDRSRKQTAEISAKVRDFQREVFRLTPADQRETKLIEWLQDPQDEVRFTALSLIKARIADEGRRPEGEILATLLKMLKQGSPGVRREVLSVVQNLNVPAVIKAVLGQLEEEKDPPTREAFFKAIARLNSPDGLTALVREIASGDSAPDCVREAATALGQLAEQPAHRDRAREAVGPLTSRYTNNTAADIPMRAALLTAMAGIGDASFTPYFLEAVESEDPLVLRPAIEGLRAVAEPSKLSRLRRHTTNANPLVRLAAIEAVGQLGREDADLECLLQRVIPTVEPNEPARDAAWRGFRDLLRHRSVGERIRAASMLREVPDREAEYLAELAERLRSAGESPAELEMVRDRLANLLVAQGKFAEALPHLRELYAQKTSRSDPTALDVGLRLLDATLRTQGAANGIDLLRQLAITCQRDEYLQTRIVETVAQFLESPELVADPARALGAIAELRELPESLLGTEWKPLLQRVSTRIEAAQVGIERNASP